MVDTYASDVPTHCPKEKHLGEGCHGNDGGVTNGESNENQGHGHVAERLPPHNNHGQGIATQPNDKDGGHYDPTCIVDLQKQTFLVSYIANIFV